MPGREPVALVAAIDWTAIMVAIITLSGVVFNGLVALWIATHVRTPSGTRIGKQVENAHHVAIANRHLLVRLSRELGLRADDPELRAAIEADEAADG